MKGKRMKTKTDKARGPEISILPERRLKKRKNAFSLIELLIVISIIAILVSIMLPALNSARSKAQVSCCLNNLKQIGTGIQMYASAYDDRCIRGKLSGTDPALNNWMALVNPQINGKEFDGKIKGVYACPAVIPSQHSDPNFPFCYSFNDEINKRNTVWTRITSLKRPSNLIGMVECILTSGTSPGFDNTRLAIINGRYGQGRHGLFKNTLLLMDGHAELSSNLWKASSSSPTSKTQYTTSN